MSSKKNRDLETSKNLIRGAIASQRKSNTPELDLKEWQQRGTAKQQMDKAFEIAKHSLTISQFKSFEDWARKTISSQTLRPRNIGTSSTNLGLFPKGILNHGLNVELQLAKERLKPHIDELVVAVTQLAEIGRLISNRKIEAARTKLAEFEERCDKSYTSIELDLYLICASVGVDEMKAQIRHLTTATSGYNKFLAYHIGQRNEPSQVAARFKSLMRRRIDEAELEPVLSTYTKYRAYSELNAIGSELGSILAAEAYTTPLDQVLTLCRITKTILFAPENFSLNEYSLAAGISQEFAQIENLLWLGSSDVYEDFGQGKLKEICLAAVLKTIGESETKHYEPLEQLAIDGIASQLSTRDDGLNSEKLAKEVLNLPWISLFSTIGELSSAGSLPKLIINMPGVMPTTHIASLKTALIGCLKDIEQKDAASASVKILQALVRLSSLRELESKYLSISEIETNPSLVLRDVFLVATAQAQQINDQFDKCLETCANAGMLNDRLIPYLPLPEMFQGARFASLIPYATSVNLPIALDHYLKIDDDRKHRTNKRYAVEELLKNQPTASLSDIPSNLYASGVPTAKIEYFCLEVCDKATLELLPGLGNSKTVKAVQAKLLRGLAGLHSYHEITYLQEADLIEEQLQVDDGVTVLDESKVFVDEKAVLNFVNQEYAADFQRYLSLVATGKGVAESVAELMKSLSALSAKNFQIPKNDADDLFGQLLAGILDRFIKDPAGGLDTIVGRRVRHGTIASELRGALEAVDLIGQKPRAGAQYDAPSRIVQLSGKYEPRKRRIINAAFARFSEAIDAQITSLRDERFHMTSKEKPRGAFDLQVNALLLTYARVIAQTCKNIESFSAECVALFWLYLATRTEAIRPTVEAETRKALQSAFDKLMNELRGLNLQEPQLMEALQKGSEDLQHRASLIASWIRVPTKTGLEGKTFPMQRILDVVLAVEAGKHPTFRPKVTSTTSEICLDAHGFSIVSDALQIALSNVAEHSGLRDGWIEINISGPDERDLVEFTVRNQIAGNIRTPDRIARITTMLADINRRAHSERARKDKGSGLSKLAVLVLQSNETSINFGFESQDIFFTRFELFFIGLRSDEFT